MVIQWGGHYGFLLKLRADSIFSRENRAVTEMNLHALIFMLKSSKWNNFTIPIYSMLLKLII